MVTAALAGDPGAAFLYNPFMATVFLVALVLLVIRITCRHKVVWITEQKHVWRWTAALVIALAANWWYVLVYHGTV